MDNNSYDNMTTLLRIMSDRWMNRRRFVTGASTISLGSIAGCISISSGGDNEAPSSEGENEDSNPTDTLPFSESDDVDFPKYSGTVSISGDEDYWSFKIQKDSSFGLRYTVTNMKSEDYDFDVLVLSQEQYGNYIQEIVDSGPVIEDITQLSSKGVTSEAQKSGELDAGTYYFVVDNTDISDAGDIGSENTREVTIEMETYDPAEQPETEGNETEESTSEDEGYTTEQSHELGETFTAGENAFKLRQTITADRLADKLGGVEAEGVFIVMNLRVTLLSDESKTLNAAQYTLRTLEPADDSSEVEWAVTDQEYEVSNLATGALENMLYIEEIRPEIEYEFKIAFDVPKRERSYALRYDTPGFATGGPPHYVGPVTPQF